MLVEFRRYQDPVHSFGDEGEDDGNVEVTLPVPKQLKIDSVGVAAVFDSSTEGATIIRTSGGKGFKVVGTYAETVEKLDGLVELVEFDRWQQEPVGFHENGDDTEQRPGKKIMINPVWIGSVFDSARTEGATIIRLFDERGFKVVGDYLTVCDKLEAGGRVDDVEEHSAAV
jgi:hypothetical protein